MLKTQLILKGVMTLEEFHNIKELIQYDFLQDGHFTELKEAELMENKLNTLSTIESYIGTFFSKKWVQQNVLRLTDLEIEEMQKQINREMELNQKMVVLQFQTVQTVSQDTHQLMVSNTSR